MELTKGQTVTVVHTSSGAEWEGRVEKVFQTTAKVMVFAEVYTSFTFHLKTGMTIDGSMRVQEPNNDLTERRWGVAIQRAMVALQELDESKYARPVTMEDVRKLEDLGLRIQQLGQHLASL